MDECLPRIQRQMADAVVQHILTFWGLRWCKVSTIGNMSKVGLHEDRRGIHETCSHLSQDKLYTIRVSWALDRFHQLTKLLVVLKKSNI